MRKQGQLLGFQLWTESGVQLFAHPRFGPQTDSELRAEVLSGKTIVETGERHGEVEADNVLVRLGSVEANPGVVAVVLLPEDRLNALRATAQTRIAVGAGLLLLLLATTLGLSRRRARRNEHAARHDSLTGLGNRTFLTTVARARSHEPCALVLLDLDGFKEVNDTLGHAAGDELLVQVARALRASVRRGDQIARLGGDEFAILLDGVADSSEALRVARNVSDGLSRVGFSVQGIELDVHASFGVSVDATGRSDVHDLLRQADVAMYRAKARSTAVVLYRPDDDHHDTDRLALLGELRRAIANDELVLHYQPVVRALATDPRGRTRGSAVGDISSVEALLRWQHPERGLLGPDAFLPAAERTGIIHALTAWVLEQAVAQGSSWLRAGLDVPIAVNVSPRAITDALVRRVLTTLDRHGLPASNLKLEITETALAEDPNATIAVLRELRAAGVQISLDDFGAGYTSLAYLTALPLTELKIDRSFIAALGHDLDTNAVVSAVIELGHRLGLEIVAEGVETIQTRDHLNLLCCDAHQGFLYSRPVRADQLTNWLTGRPAPGAWALSRGATEIGTETIQR